MLRSPDDCHHIQSRCSLPRRELWHSSAERGRSSYVHPRLDAACAHSEGAARRKRTCQRAKGCRAHRHQQAGRHHGEIETTRAWCFRVAPRACWTCRVKRHRRAGLRYSRNSYSPFGTATSQSVWWDMRKTWGGPAVVGVLADLLSVSAPLVGREGLRACHGCEGARRPLGRMLSPPSQQRLRTWPPPCP